MKTVRNLFLIYILSFITAVGSTFINDTLVVNYRLEDRLTEAALISIPVFLVLSLLYIVNRLVVKTLKAVKKKKPSGTEGSTEIKQ
ncbi:hypothetical protein [Flavobacterium sp.]|uniref:hypothetical protein n=1 Tax=Flavobacterium sp. TaxID=239 RepID=UPI0026207EB6|nr:hypothetical protein [Flavobacterium sp.]